MGGRGRLRGEPERLEEEKRREEGLREDEGEGW